MLLLFVDSRIPLWVLRKLFLCFSPIFLVAALNISNGQSFGSDGLFTPKASSGLYSTTSSVTQSSQVPVPGDMASYKERLLSRVNDALYNLENDSLDLKGIYNFIWGESLYNDLHGELKDLQSYLQTGTVVGRRYTYVIDPNDINSFASQNNSHTTTDPFVSYEDFLKVKLWKIDLLASHLLNKYNNDLQSDAYMGGQYLKNKYVDQQYLEDWRKLEASLAKLRLDRRVLLQTQADIYNYDEDKIQGVRADIISTDPTGLEVVKWIKGSSFLKKWLWYTGGIPNINPLLVTTAANRYPLNEYNTFLTPQRRVLQDSLNKLSALKLFTNTEYVLNKVLLPVRPTLDKNEYFLVQYDASSYTAISPLPDEFSERNRLVRGVIFNVPKDKRINFSKSEEDLTFESKWTSSLNEVADKIGIVTSLGASNISTFLALEKKLNAVELANVQLRVSDASNMTVVHGSPAIAFDNNKSVKPGFNDNGKNKGKDTNSVFPHIWSPSEDRLPFYGNTFPDTVLVRLVSRSIWVIVEKDKNKRKVPLTGTKLLEDKRRILWVAWPDNSDDVAKKGAMKKRIEKFIDLDRDNFINYTDGKALKASSDQMCRRFFQFMSVTNAREKALATLIDSIDCKIKEVSAYVSIYNRSLPPGILHASADTNARYTTEMIAFPVVKAPKTLKYVLIESDQNGKGISRVVDKRTVKFIKPLRFDLSIGLGGNFSKYDVSRSSDSGLPTSTVGDVLQFVAGGHLYLFNRLNKLHDKFLGYPRERFSLYGGLSIKRALDNYYLGISYDYVPGLRVVLAAHFYKNERFKIVNNSVADQATGVEYAGLFLSFNFEPITVGKAIGLFK